MLVPCEKGARQASRGVRRLVRRGLIVLAVAASVFVWANGRETVNAWAARAGHRRVGLDQGFVAGVLRAPLRALRRPPADAIAFDVKFEHVLELRNQQQEALARGWIPETAKGWVPAELVGPVGRQRGEVRLKGDLLDHVRGPKVSLRVRLEGEAHWQGLRHFSVQAPETKGFQLEALFHSTVRHAGVVSPRYEFVEVGLNGDRVGVMAMEEHCAKELLERSGRRESVIARFDEASLFVNQMQLRSVESAQIVLDDYRTAAPVVFHGAAVEASEPLRRLRRVATSALRAFQFGELHGADVFDVPQLASYLAVCELWGAWHAIRWHNLRFHLDPVTGRLAPVGFDGNLQMRREVGRVVLGEEPMLARLLAEPEIGAAVRARLDWICREVIEGGLVDELAALEAKVLPVLQRDYVLLTGFDFEELRARARFHRAVSDAALRAPGVLRPQFRPVQGFTVHNRVLELHNNTPWPAAVLGLRWSTPDGVTKTAAEVAGGGSFPLRLPPKPTEGSIARTTLALVPPAAADAVLEYEVELDGAPEGRQWLGAFAASPLPRGPLVPQANLAETCAAHPSLAVDPDGSTLTLPSGRHEFRRTLVIPRGCRLRLQPGSELRFAPAAALVAHGPIEARGTAAAPIVLGPADASAGWLGLAVLTPGGGATTHLEHVRIEDTRTTAVGDWQLTGGVTLLGGTARLRDVTFAGTTAEDALNIIHAQVDLERVHIERTASDAFDGDFVLGRVAACTFTAIGGDALDFSGSTVVVEGCRVQGARDKALSVGEASQITARDLGADDVGAAVAVKDGSTLQARGVVARRIHIAAAMAYLKKPGYGPSRAEVVGLDHTGDVPNGLCQLGNALTLDGVTVPPQPLDVEKLYETVMRKR